VPTSAASAAPSHGLDIRRGSILDSESIGDRRRRCDVRNRRNAHCKYCRRSEGKQSFCHGVFSVTLRPADFSGHLAQWIADPCCHTSDRTTLMQIKLCGGDQRAALLPISRQTAGSGQDGCRALRQWSARGEQVAHRYRRLHESWSSIRRATGPVLTPLRWAA
jgi:hypothetical protein